ncbi:MAG: hypothetical protein MHM6MM_007584, partial [Cercozoa sp. M6MM]
MATTNICPSKWYYLSFGTELEVSASAATTSLSKVVLNFKERAAVYVQKEKEILQLAYYEITQIKEPDNEEDTCFTVVGSNASVQHRMGSVVERKAVAALFRRFMRGFLKREVDTTQMLPLKQGIVRKKGQLKKAQRYLCLANGRLFVMRKPASQYPLNVFTVMPSNWRSIPDRSSPGIKLVGAGGKRDVDLHFGTAGERDLWADAIAMLSDVVSFLPFRARPSARTAPSPAVTVKKTVSEDTTSVVSSSGVSVTSVSVSSPGSSDDSVSNPVTPRIRVDRSKNRSARSDKKKTRSIKINEGEKHVSRVKVRPKSREFPAMPTIAPPPMPAMPD